MNQQDRIESLGARTAATTVAGNALSRIDNLGGKRNGLRITNNDSSLVVGLTYVSAGAAAPVIGTTPYATMMEDYIPARGTLTLQISSNVDVYACNSSGAATTSNVTVREIS